MCKAYGILGIKRVDHLDDGVFYPRRASAMCQWCRAECPARKDLSGWSQMVTPAAHHRNLEIVARQAIHISAPMVVHGRVHFHEVNSTLIALGTSSRPGAGHSTSANAARHTQKLFWSFFEPCSNRCSDGCIAACKDRQSLKSAIFRAAEAFGRKRFGHFSEN